MNAIQEVRVLPCSGPLTDDPTVEAKTLRGVWFGLLLAAPLWLLIAALVVAVL